MPPKGKGKSKADKEKQKKEEAEQRAREEEEARLLAEQEERERKEREKVEAEETRRLENEERKRRKGQLEELESIWMGHVQKLANELAEARKKAKWARYMRCDGSPDPTIQGEINTYINLWRESKEDIDIDAVLTESDLTLSLIQELMELIEETPSDEMKEGEVMQHQETMVELQRLLKEKLDLASHDLLLKSSAKADAETMNLQQIIANDQISLCMWGNLSKNPRIKSHEFEDKGFTFEMPKLLTLSDIAFRVLFTKYDHHSPHCRTYLPRIKPKIEELPEAEEEEEKEETTEEAKPEGEEEEKADGEQSEADGVGREETNDVGAALKGLDGDEEEEPKEEEPQEEAEPLEEDYEIKTPEPLEFEDFDGDDDAVDLRAYHILGGVFYFNLLHLPPQPKPVKSWVITQIVDPPELHYYDYISDFVISPPETSEDGEEKEKEAEKEDILAKLEKGKEKKEEEKKLERPPIGVVMKLPEDVYFCEEPQVVRWDDEKKFWRLDGFHGHNFDEEKRILAFKTNYFGTMALIQDAHINMPFQSWEIRPRGLNHAQLTIIAAIVEIEIQIKNDVVCLSQPEDRSELAHLINQWMTPKELIKKLRIAGVNVFPDVDSSKYVSTQNKNVIAERRFYQQMSMVASSMAFSWSKWNNENEDADKIVVQGTEHMKDEPLLEDEWALFLITKKRTTKLKCTEFDETFAEEHAEGTEFHADMYHMYLDIGSEEGRARVLNSNHRFINNVFKLLDATKVITYS